MRVFVQLARLFEFPRALHMRLRMCVRVCIEERMRLLAT